MEVFYLYICSNDDFKFAELPEARWAYADQIRMVDEFFSGQHERILIKTAEYNRMINAFGGADVKKEKNVTELDRLSIIVNLIAR